MKKKNKVKDELIESIFSKLGERINKKDIKESIDNLSEKVSSQLLIDIQNGTVSF